LANANFIQRSILPFEPFVKQIFLTAERSVQAKNICLNGKLENSLELVSKILVFFPKK